MKKQEIRYGQEAREGLLAGMEKLAGAVSPSYGPKGKNAAYSHAYLPPEISNDGVSIANKVYSVDAYEALGAELLRNAAQNTENTAGDGTTLTVILTYEFMREGIRLLAAGYNPILLRKGMKQAEAFVQKRLKEQAKLVQTKAQIEQIAAISAGDLELGKVVSDAYEKAGNQGVVWVEENWGLETEVRYTNGILLEGGYYSIEFAAEGGIGSVEYENSYILLLNENVKTIEDISPVLEEAFARDVPIILVAEDIKDSVVHLLTANLRRIGLKVCAVRMPYYGESRRAAMEDLALVTGGFCYHVDCGRSMTDLTLEDCGRAEKVIVDKKKAIFTGSWQKNSRIETRIAYLWEQLKGETEEYEREKILRRISFLTGGISVIYPGGYSELEIIEKKKRFEDAVNAVRIAASEGILPGGGTSLLYLSEELEALEKELEGDEKMGVSLLRSALKKPVAILAENSGQKAEWVVQTLLEKENRNLGYDGNHDAIVSMWEAGILDPLKVVSSAVCHAVSMASTVLTTEAVVADLSEDAHRPPVERI